MPQVELVAGQEDLRCVVLDQEGQVPEVLLASAVVIGLQLGSHLMFDVDDLDKLVLGNCRDDLFGPVWKTGRCSEVAWCYVLVVRWEAQPKMPTSDDDVYTDGSWIQGSIPGATDMYKDLDARLPMH